MTVPARRRHSWVLVSEGGWDGKKSRCRTCDMTRYSCRFRTDYYRRDGDYAGDRAPECVPVEAPKVDAEESK